MKTFCFFALAYFWGEKDSNKLQPSFVLRVWFVAHNDLYYRICTICYSWKYKNPHKKSRDPISSQPFSRSRDILCGFSGITNSTYTVFEIIYFPVFEKCVKFNFESYRMSTLFWHRLISVNSFLAPKYFWKKVENFDSKWSFGRNKKVEVEKRSKYSFTELKQYSKLTKATLKNIELGKSVSVEIVLFQKDNENHK